MTREEKEKLLIQEAKGRIAGAILQVALERRISLRDAKALLGEYGEYGAEAAWRQMHSVAHMWAAAMEFPELFPDGFGPVSGLSAKGDLKPFLRRSEELLAAMQARPDLAHPDPVRCSPEIRRELGLETLP